MRNDEIAPGLCPECSDPGGRLLVILSAIAYADYFQCQQCDHVWHEPRVSETSAPAQVGLGDSLPPDALPSTL